MLNDIFNYLLFSSAILVYGIGMNRATVFNDSPKIYFFSLVKMLLSVISTCALTYLIAIKILLPVDLIELYPFAATLIFCLISLVFETILRSIGKTNTADFSVSLLCVLLAVSESTNLLQAVVISASCVVSFFLFIPILITIRKRIELSHPTFTFENSSLILISFIILIFVLYAWNLSWFNPEVLQ